MTGKLLNLLGLSIHNKRPWEVLAGAWRDCKGGYGCQGPQAQTTMTRFACPNFVCCENCSRESLRSDMHVELPVWVESIAESLGLGYGPLGPQLQLKA